MPYRWVTRYESAASSRLVALTHPTKITLELRCGGGLADRGVHARHDLLGHQLHGALVERRFHPVHSRIDQLAKIADLLAQGEDPVDHLVDAAVDHAMVHDIVMGDLLVGLLLE